MKHNNPEQARGIENGTSFKYGIRSIRPWRSSSGSDRYPPIMGPRRLTMKSYKREYLANAMDTKMSPVVTGNISCEQTSDRTVLQIPRYPSMIPQIHRRVMAA